MGVVDLTPVVHEMAKAYVNKKSGDPETFGKLPMEAQQIYKQFMLDQLIPALPTLEAQVASAVELAMIEKEAA